MQYSKYLRPILASVLFVFMLVLLAKSLMTYRSSVLAHPQDEERKLENLIPKNVPISIKIKKEKEKSFKNLTNENWAHEFELEVTNTGDKPIYKVFLVVTLDVKDANGVAFSANLYWGRAELGDYRVHANPDDPQIRPGESVVLEFHSAYVNALDKMRREEGRSLPSKLQVELGNLSFGDGTGYMTNSGTLMPRARKISRTKSPDVRSDVMRNNHSAMLGRPPTLHPTSLRSKSLIGHHAAPTVALMRLLQIGLPATTAHNSNAAIPSRVQSWENVSQ